MKKKLRTSLATAVTMALLLTGCGSSIYASHSSDYVKETHVNGALFDSPSSIIDQATAITAITNDMESGTYLYKDGESTYLLFDSDSIVIMAQRGTEFNFSNSSDYETTLKEHGLNTIWFDEIDENLNYKTSTSNGNFKIIMDVKADVSITSDVYGLFAGKLAVLEANGEEYAIFIGVPGETMKVLSNGQKDMVNHVVASLNVNTEYIPADETKEEKQSDKETETSTAEESQSEPVSNEVVDGTAEQEEEIEPVEEEVTVEPAENSDNQEVILEEVDSSKEKNTDEKAEDASTDTSSEEEEKVEDANKNAEDVSKDKTSTKNSQKDSVVYSNQKNDTEAASSLYNMKSVGDTTTIAAQTYDSKNYEMGTITLDALMTGEDAISFLKTKLGEKYKDADPGMSWNVIKYTSTINPEDAYIDARLEGLDGEKLKHKGLSYSKRTFDYLKEVTAEGTSYTNYYQYYQVPNGCREYLVELGMFGNNADDIRSLNAYYKISL